MSSEKLAEFALARIRDVLGDDVNYQTSALKLGGIWNWCDVVAEYRRGEHTLGKFLEVQMKDSIGGAVPRRTPGARDE